MDWRSETHASRLRPHLTDSQHYQHSTSTTTQLKLPEDDVIRHSALLSDLVTSVKAHYRSYPRSHQLLSGQRAMQEMLLPAASTQKVFEEAKLEVLSLLVRSSAVPA